MSWTWLLFIRRSWTHETTSSLSPYIITCKVANFHLYRLSKIKKYLAPQALYMAVHASFKLSLITATPSSMAYPNLRSTSIRTSWTVEPIWSMALVNSVMWSHFWKISTVYQLIWESGSRSFGSLIKLSMVRHDSIWCSWFTPADQQSLYTSLSRTCSPFLTCAPNLLMLGPLHK